MPDVFGVLMQWLHVSSMAILVGGLIYARLAMTPACQPLAPEERDATFERAAAFRPLAFAAVMLAVKPRRQRRPRSLTSAFVSGLIVILIAAYLRSTY